MLGEMERRAHLNGYPSTRMLSAQQVLDIEYALGPGVAGGLEAPEEGLVCPWTTMLAFASQATVNGAQFSFESRVTDVVRQRDLTWQLNIDGSEPVLAKYVVNAAGVHVDDINAVKIADIRHNDFFNCHVFSLFALQF